MGPSKKDDLLWHSRDGVETLNLARLQQDLVDQEKQQGTISQAAQRLRLRSTPGYVLTFLHATMCMLVCIDLEAPERLLGAF